MRRPKVYTHLTKRVFRSELTTCLTCGTRLRRYATLAQRTVITLDGPIRVTHTGYRCPNPACLTQRRSYRSAAADSPSSSSTRPRGWPCKRTSARARR